MKLMLAWLAPEKSRIERFSWSCSDEKNWSRPLLARFCGPGPDFFGGE
jgi:hypothetical protein